jgi:sulfur-oxidizing protein SoxY
MAQPPSLRRRRWLQRAMACSGVGLWRGVPAEPAELRGLHEDDNPDTSPMWLKMRAQLFGDRQPQTAREDQLSLSAPRRAADPAFVPLVVRSGLPHDGPGRVQRIALLIDQNPSPIGALIDLPPNGAWPELETRIRVDQYTFVRVVAQTADGGLYMATRFVKASGGCSAAAAADEAAAHDTLGRMALRAEGPRPAPGTPLTLQWQISHPNHSGLAMNPFTRQYVPADYVRSLNLWQGERLLLTADMDIAFSENPMLRLRFVPQGEAPLRAEVVDSQQRRFHSEQPYASLWSQTP